MKTLFANNQRVIFEVLSSEELSSVKGGGNIDMDLMWDDSLNYPPANPPKQEQPKQN